MRAPTAWFTSGVFAVCLAEISAEMRRPHAKVRGGIAPAVGATIGSPSAAWLVRIHRSQARLRPDNQRPQSLSSWLQTIAEPEGSAHPKRCWRHVPPTGYTPSIGRADHDVSASKGCATASAARTGERSPK
jgi:hypothetical protein